MPRTRRHAVIGFVTTPDSFPDDIAALKTALIAERAARIDAQAQAASATANMSSAEALVAHLKLVIEKMRRELYGSRSERGRKLLDQMELELEDLEARLIPLTQVHL